MIIIRKLILITIFLLGIFLNQSSIIFNINFSIADFIIIILIILMFLNNKLELLLKETIFFLIVVSLTLFTANFFIPNVLLIQVSQTSIIVGFIKLVAVFIYLIAGYNLSKLGYSEKILKYFSLGSLVIAFISIFLITFKTFIPYSQIFFFGNSSRYKGLMNDPNYFAVLQCVAIVYYINNNKINSKQKVLITVILIFSILISGSKTGSITLLIFTLYKILKLVVSNINEINIKRIFLILILLIFLPIILKQLEIVLFIIAQRFPVINRILSIFTNFTQAINAEGSGREISWKNAISIIKISPIIGIGVGTYSTVANKLFNLRLIAHNTYLQLTVEWGIPLAFIFIIYVLYQLIKLASTKEKIYNFYSESLIVFLISSLAISLNNARLFWILLGTIIFHNKRIKILNVGEIHG